MSSPYINVHHPFLYKWRIFFHNAYLFCRTGIHPPLVETFNQVDFGNNKLGHFQNFISKAINLIDNGFNIHFFTKLLCGALIYLL